MTMRILMFPMIVLIVLYFIISHIIPTAKDVETTKGVITKKQTDLEDLEVQLSKITKYKNDIIANKKENEFVMNFVPNENREEILINDISQLATDSGIELFSINLAEAAVPRNSKDTGNVRYMNGKMIISGTYEQIKSFSDKLFKMKRLYSFNSIELTKPDKEKGGEDASGEGNQGLILSGNIVFGYGLMPGLANVTSDEIGRDVNVSLINDVIEYTVATDELVSEPAHRVNPFLP